jgi:chromosome segregation ATPase
MGEGDEERDDPLALELQQLQITHEDLQKEHDTLNASHAEVCATLEAAQARVAELETQLAEAVKDRKNAGNALDACKLWNERLRHDFASARQTIEAALREFQP